MAQTARDVLGRRLPSDLDAVELLFTSLLVQATTAMLAAGSRQDAHGRSRTRSFRQSFLAAYAQRIGERLASILRPAVHASASWLAGQLAAEPDSPAHGRPRDQGRRGQYGDAIVRAARVRTARTVRPG